MSKAKMSHRERLETCIAGERPDRVPVALWRHFPVDDQTPDGLAAATTAFQKTFDFDLIKVTPASSFCIVDWGKTDVWRGHYHGTRDYVDTVIKHPDDWTKIKVLDPTKGQLGKQVKALKYLVDEFGTDTPIIQTIFSPLSQVKNLVGKQEHIGHLRKYPNVVKDGLARIMETTLRFIEEISKLDIAGIFYAVQHAQYGLMAEEEFLEFGKPDDLNILSSANHFWLNLLHIHGQDIMFDHVKDYPVQIINWHDLSTPPSLKEARGKVDNVLCGGLRQEKTMILGTPETVKQEARKAIRDTDGMKFILGTGCVTPTTAPYGNIMAARKVVEEAIE